jgi:hypothetical protein
MADASMHMGFDDSVNSLTWATVVAPKQRGYGEG